VNNEENAQDDETRPSRSTQKLMRPAVARDPEHEEGDAVDDAEAQSAEEE
jgi:hypothetical protein